MTLAPADVAPQEPPRPPGRGAVAADWLAYAGRRLLTGVGTMFFVLVFNFFLFRLLPGRPDRALHPRPQHGPRPAARAAPERSTSRSAQQFIDYLRNPFSSGVDSTQFSRPVWDVIGDYVWPTVVLLGTVDGAVGGHRHRHRHQRRLEARQHLRPDVAPAITLTLYAMPEFWLGMVLLILFSTGIGPFPGIFPSGGTITPGLDQWSLEGILDQLWHLALPAATLTLAYLAEYSLVMRSSLVDELRPGLPDHRARQGPDGQAGAPPARRAQRAAADDHAGLPQHRLRRVRRHHRRDGLLLARPGPAVATRRSAVRTCRCCRRSSCCSRSRSWSPTSWPTSWSPPSTRGCAHDQPTGSRRRRCRPGRRRARARRRAALRRFWAAFRRERAGLVGPGDPRGLRRCSRCGSAAVLRRRAQGDRGHRRTSLAAAERRLPARHRRVRPVGARAGRLGRPGVAARRHRRDGHLDGHRHLRRHRLRALRRLAGLGASSASPTGSWSSRSCRWPSCSRRCSARRCSTSSSSSG